MAQIVWISGGAGLLALAFALFSSGRIRSFEVTNERVNELSGIIQRGSMAFLSREYRALVPFVVVVGAVLWLKIGHPMAVSFLLGAFCSGLAGLVARSAEMQGLVDGKSLASHRGNAQVGLEELAHGRNLRRQRTLRACDQGGGKGVGIAGRPQRAQCAVMGQHTE